MRRLLLLLAVTGCQRPTGPHVTLHAPYPNAPIEERRQAFTRLEADGGTRVKTTFFLSNAPDVDYLQLADGTKVFDVEDFTPVVREASPTAQAIRQLQRARTKRTIGWVALLGGLVLGSGPLTAGIVVISRSDDPGASAHAKAGGVALTVLGSALIAGGFGYGLYAEIDGAAKARAATRRAFERYTESLAETLRICTKGLELIDCETGR